MFYIFEHQIRPDGVVNTSETARSTFASGLSYYHERISKMVMNETFTSVHLILADEKLNVIERIDVETQYKAPEESQEESQEEAAE